MPHKLIHVAKIFDSNKGWSWLYLRNTGKSGFVWFHQPNETEEATEIRGDNAETAIYNARQQWKDQFFTTLKCGFRFTLPERDEIGSNALFHQMYASYAIMNGVYFDEEVGHQCIVREASSEALNLMKTLQARNAV